MMVLGLWCGGSKMVMKIGSLEGPGEVPGRSRSVPKRPGGEWSADAGSDFSKHTSEHIAGPLSFVR